MIDTSHTENSSETFASASERRAAEQPGARTLRSDEHFPLEHRPTTLAELCPGAIADVSSRFSDRTIEYAPDPDPAIMGSGQWDARRVAYALTILLEDALKRTGPADTVSVRWREHEDVAVLRVHYPRPHERGDFSVSYFEDGVQPDGADDNVGTLRIAAALKIARQHGGQLARVRTRAGTAYVLELPRSPAPEAPETDARTRDD